MKRSDGASPMKLRILLAGSCIFLLAPGAVFSFGNNRGGHGGFGGGSRGGGGERREFGGGEAMHRTPSMSGGAGAMRGSFNRPSSGAGMVPHGGSNFANRGGFNNESG